VFGIGLVLIFSISFMFMIPLPQAHADCFLIIFCDDPSDYVLDFPDYEYAADAKYLGVLGYCYPYIPDRDAPPGTIALHRYYNDDSFDHYYSIYKMDIPEYVYEGITCYIEPTGPLTSGFLKDQLLGYFNSYTADHLLSTRSDAASRSALIGANYNPDYPNEVIGALWTITAPVHFLQDKVPLCEFILLDTGHHFYTATPREFDRSIYSVINPEEPCMARSR
jgi:hypothetical protein